jgi:hypothetical protein
MILKYHRGTRESIQMGSTDKWIAVSSQVVSAECVRNYKYDVRVSRHTYFPPASVLFLLPMQKRRRAAAGEILATFHAPFVGESPS